MINNALTDALNTWSKWQIDTPEQPVYVRELTSGKTNKSHLVRVAKKHYVIRLNAHNEYALAVNRFHEQLIVEKLYPLGISPKIVYPCVTDSINKHAVTVFEYVEGDVWRSQDIADEHNQQRLLKVIDSYKNVILNVPRFDYVACVLEYWRAIEKKGIVVDCVVANKFRIFVHNLESFTRNQYQPVLSHHDLVADNILETKNGLMIIDWEYAGLGHPDFDRVYMKKNISSANEMQLSNIDLSEIEFKSPIEQIIDWLNVLWLMLR